MSVRRLHRIPAQGYRESIGCDDLDCVYQMTLKSKILGMFGESWRELDRRNWPHGCSSLSEDTMHIADLNNWWVQEDFLCESTDSSGDQ